MGERIAGNGYHDVAIIAVPDAAGRDGYFGCVVVVGGHVYGVDGRVGRKVYVLPHSVFSNV